MNVRRRTKRKEDLQLVAWITVVIALWSVIATLGSAA